MMINMKKNNVPLVLNAAVLTGVCILSEVVLETRTLNVAHYPWIAKWEAVEAIKRILFWIAANAF